MGVNPGKGRAHIFDYFQRIGRGQNPYAHERGRLTVESDILIVVLRAQDDVGNLAQSHHDTVLLFDHHLAEVFRSFQIRIRHQVH